MGIVDALSVASHRHVFTALAIVLCSLALSTRTDHVDGAAMHARAQAEEAQYRVRQIESKVSSLRVDLYIERHRFPLRDRNIEKERQVEVLRAELLRYRRTPCFGLTPTEMATLAESERTR